MEPASEPDQAGEQVGVVHFLAEKPPECWVEIN